MGMGTQTFQLNRTNNIHTHSNVKIYKLNIDEDSQGLVTIICKLCPIDLQKNRFFLPKLILLLRQYKLRTAIGVDHYRNETDQKRQ